MICPKMTYFTNKVYEGFRLGHPRRGAIMGNVVYDFLRFSCMALFVTGIVVAAASLLI